MSTGAPDAYMVHFITIMFLISNDNWRIQKTKEKGNGVFAKKIIPAGTIIGDYLGTIIDITSYDASYDMNGLYLMHFTKRAFIYPEIHTPGVHLINHSCSPNCWIYIYRGHTLFFTLRDITPDEELTISYLLSPDETCDPCSHICKCGNNYCSGSMHLTKNKYKIWQKFLDKEKKKTRIAKFIYGKSLKKLSSYPKINPYNPIYAKIYSPEI